MMNLLSRRALLFGTLVLTCIDGISAFAADKLQLIMFERAGCPWCAKWDAEVGPVYEKTWEGKRAPIRRLSMYPPYPPALSFIKDIVYSPTFVLIRGKSEIGRIVGYPGEAFFYVNLSQLLEKAGN